MGSCLAIGIVGFIFITLIAAGRGVGRVKLQSGADKIPFKELARPLSTLSIKSKNKTKHETTTFHRAPCS
jgi:hypothetical protein